MTWAAKGSLPAMVATSAFDRRGTSLGDRQVSPGGPVFTGKDRGRPIRPLVTGRDWLADWGRFLASAQGWKDELHKLLGDRLPRQCITAPAPAASVQEMFDFG
ncbi:MULTISPECIES: hypothetical protein [unclassified Streptomyces]|uniref:hypothetical protein n=1 Tax=unclassified Streptomyces TaxID=2593676 RepID=UPI003830B6F6